MRLYQVVGRGVDLEDGLPFRIHFSELFRSRGEAVEQWPRLRDGCSEVKRMTERQRDELWLDVAELELPDEPLPGLGQRRP